LNPLSTEKARRILIASNRAPQGRIWKSSDFLHRMDTQRPQPCLVSTQALRSRRMSSTSKLLGGSDWAVRPPPGRLNRLGWLHLLVESSASILWFKRVTSGFLVNHCKPREMV
jgi:hypothetical protein